MKSLRSSAVLLAAIAGLAASARAQVVYLDETFESDTIGLAPTDSSQRRLSLVTVEAGSGVMGSDNLARINDNSSGAGGQLEYNLGSSALGSLYVQFDLVNNAPGGVGAGTQPLIFAVGNWSDSASALLNANANRAFGLEFSGTGETSTLKIRVGSSAVFTSTYDMAALQTVKIFINDHDTYTLDYLMPGTGATATLGANSAVIFINDALVGAELSSGFAMSVSGTTGGNTTGDTTLGRLGFNSASATIADFSVDNIRVTSIPSAVPEPSAFATLAGLGALGLAALRRRRRA